MGCHRRVLSRGVIWSDVCFKRIPLALVLRTDYNRSKEGRWEAVATWRSSGELDQADRHGNSIRMCLEGCADAACVCVHARKERSQGC